MRDARTNAVLERECAGRARAEAAQLYALQLHHPRESSPRYVTLSDIHVYLWDCAGSAAHLTQWSLSRLGDRAPLFRLEYSIINRRGHVVPGDGGGGGELDGLEA